MSNVCSLTRPWIKAEIIYSFTGKKYIVISLVARKMSQCNKTLYVDIFVATRLLSYSPVVERHMQPPHHLCHHMHQHLTLARWTRCIFYSASKILSSNWHCGFTSSFICGYRQVLYRRILLSEYEVAYHIMIHHYSGHEHSTAPTKFSFKLGPSV